MPSANDLSARIANDPQMQLPVYPHLPDDFVTIYAGPRLVIFSGGMTDVILRGKSVSKLLPRLLPLLDGKQTIEDIASRINGFSEKTVRDAIALLYMRGVLQDGHYRPQHLTGESVQAFKQQIQFYSRFVDVTRSARNSYEIFERLQTARVLLVTQGRVAQAAVRELILMGIGRLTIAADDAMAWPNMDALSPFTTVAFTDADTLPDVIQAHDLMLFITDTPDTQRVAWLNQMARDADIPLQCATIRPNAVDVGHIYFPNQSPCYECARLQYPADATPPEASHLPFEQMFAETISPEEQLGIGQMVLSVMNLLTHLTSLGESVAYRLDTGTTEWESRPIEAITACPVCGLADYDFRDFPLAPDYRENLPTLYHRNARVRGYDMNPKGHQVHYRDDVMKTVKNAIKSYDGVPRIALPGMDTTPPGLQTAYPQTLHNLDSQTTPNAQPVTLDTLSVLLRVIAGVETLNQNDFIFQMRVTPSGGNLLSQSLYVVNYHMADLEPGIYYFHQSGTLEQLRTGDFRSVVDGAVPGAAAVSDDTAAVILQTNNMARIESKYGKRAFMFAMLDAGVMQHSLQYVSQALGIVAHESFNFDDDRLNTLLDFYTANEFVSTVTYLLHTDSEKGQSA